MSDDKITLRLSPQLQLIRDEADSMGVGFPRLLTADVGRYRQLAAAQTQKEPRPRVSGPGRD